MLETISFLSNKKDKNQLASFENLKFSQQQKF